MDKRVIHVEISDRVRVGVSDINRGLQGLAIQAEDSYDFEVILTNAVLSLYQALPNGERNYGAKNPRIGRVWLSRFNSKEPGMVEINYNPSAFYKEEWDYDQKTIGTIDLREKTYLAEWSEIYDEEGWRIPRVLMKDTEKVMECLGLKKQDK